MEIIQLLPIGAIAAILVSYTLAALVFETFRQKSDQGKAPLPPSAAVARPIIGHLPCLGGSQLLQECFTTQDVILANCPRLVAFKILDYRYALFGLSSYGPNCVDAPKLIWVSINWQRLRKITITEFLSNNRVSALKHARESVIRKFLKELHDMCKGDNGAVVDMRSWLNTVTYDVVFKMVVGKSYQGIGEGSGKRDEKFKRVLTSMMELLGVFVLGDTVPYLKWWDLGGYKKAMKRTARDLDEVLDGWLREHK